MCIRDSNSGVIHSGLYYKPGSLKATNCIRGYRMPVSYTHLDVYKRQGYHIGMVSLQGELVRLQMKRKKVVVNDDLKVIYRVANEKDLEKHTQTVARDLPVMYRSREIIRESKLNMKLSDVEFQSDNTKATFYYSSEERVDFRELIKLLASEFRVRVEMKQISLRQEASRLGGIGSCGRELCCSTWLTDFKTISTCLLYTSRCV